MYFERSNVVFAILFCFVQNKFVFCKAIVGFFILVSSETMFWLLSFSEKQYVFDCVEDENIRES
jgi:membrane glycosyltransferase